MNIRHLAAAALVAAGTLSAALPAAAINLVPACTTPTSADDAEAPCNPYLADSGWAGNHRNTYAQGSSHLPGPVGPPENINVDHDSVPAVPVIVSFSPPYPDGERVLWASTVGFTGQVIKVDTDTMTTIDTYIPQFEEGAAPQQPTVSGAYNLVDVDNHLHVGQSDALEVYGDTLPGVRLSTISLLRRFELPASALCGNDSLVGLSLTYDGRIAFATANGVVGTVPREPALMTEANLVTHSINGDDCAGGPDGPVEVVSNSIATDENGGIYVVTGHGMYRIDWDGTTLTQTWRSSYAGAGQAGGGRLGPGSGSTPSLMGTAADDDRFVVITDGQELMHLVLMWRDEIPSDWEPVRDGADRRIACEIPVTFGDPDATRSLSEQSVLVRGHRAVVVNNLQPADGVVSILPPQVGQFGSLFTGTEGNVPVGVEQFRWDESTRTCEVVWANPDVAIPNGIPTMSAATNMMYGIGVRAGVWTLEGLDWDTGEVLLTVPTTASPTSNSTYAGTTVGHDGTIWTGTFGGVTRFQPCDPALEPDCGRRADAFEAILGTFPTDVQAFLRDTVGLPNDTAPDAAPDDGTDGGGAGGGGGSAGEDETAAGGDLAATGGGAAALALTSLGLAGMLRRRQR